MLTVQQYNKLRGQVLQAISSNTKISDVDTEFDRDALRNLHDQFMVRHLKEASKSVYMMKFKILNRVAAGESLLTISKEYGISSYKVAKTYVELTFEGLTMSKIIQNPNLISNLKLRLDILKCITDDPVCSHEVAQQHEAAGKEYEEFLTDQLNQLSLCFETETDLRNRGNSKTPDIYFLIPMSVSLPYHSHAETYGPLSSSSSSSSSSTFVVNWIDSKAMFADHETYQEHYQQLRAYIHRYGRGMVIYWYGFVDSLLAIADPNIIIVSSLPTSWTYPTGQAACLRSS